MFSLLIVDKELNISESLLIRLRESNVQLLHVDSVENCFEQIGLRSFDLILLEVPDSEYDCLANLDRIKKVSPRSEIIMLAHERQIKQAILSLKAGASDVYIKPLDFSILMKKLDKMRSEDKITSNLLRKPGEEPRTFSHLSSRNFHFQKVLDELEDLAGTNVNILLSGESGTGKSVIARVIHKTSNLRDSGFVEINCRTISAPQLESMLFGIEKDAISDTQETVKGQFELDTAGTLFLNEISSLDINMQSKLLDAIEQNNFHRASTRIISASNTDLADQIRNRKFREDLYLRLNSTMFEISPLRERCEDIVDLFLRFVDEFNIKLKRSVSRLTPEAGEILRNYYWPGNIQELRNLCESIMARMKGNTIGLQQIPDEIKIRKLDAFKSLEEIQREHILSTLDAMKWNKSKTAKVLGISRTTLISKVKQYQEEQN